MANPERENLRLITDKQNHTTEIHINPRCFSIGALREIMRFQVFRDDASVEVAIVNGKTALLSASTICRARNLFGNDRRRFLDATALVMRDTKEVIIRVI